MDTKPATLALEPGLADPDPSRRREVAHWICFNTSGCDIDFKQFPLPPHDIEKVAQHLHQWAAQPDP